VLAQSWLVPALARQPLVWGLSVLFYGVGDTVTTAVGLADGAVAEAGPVAVRVVGHAGIGGLVALKVGFFFASFGLWYVVRTPGRVAIPLALAVAGVLVTGWNSAVLLA
jgi:hypothetical protein